MKRLAALWIELVRRTDYERCLRPRVTRFSLEPVQRLLRRLGDPQQELPVLHVAGSKGKGSTCFFLERGLRNAGLRTGLYLSPHLESWRERISLGGLPAGEEILAPALEAVLSEADDSQTFFDLLTAAAFLVFARAGCDAAVMEVGLGGRLDSTNCAHPLAAVVTSIEREHADVLGNDLLEIAREKAGIFKSGARLWSGLLRDHPARPVLVERAAEAGEPLRELPASIPRRKDLPHPQPHMQRNYALANAVLADLESGDPRFAGAARGLERLAPDALRLPGRWEKRRLPDGREVILDVAHTADSIRALLLAFRNAWPRRSRGVVVGFRDDKNLEALAAALGPPPEGERWWSAPAGDHPLSAPPEKVAALFHATPLKTPSFPEGPQVLLVTGSTYLVGALRPSSAGPVPP
ncbi:MAG: bifunctional folylpolyglutamate synthase/dihydrofolate synthase [Planctomycetota bacterium]